MMHLASDYVHPLGRRAAEGDEEALDTLLAKGEAVPVPVDRQQPAEKTIVPLAKKPRQDQEFGWRGRSG